MTQNETSTALSPRQDKAILALLTTPTVDQAARTAGVGRTTVHRWLNDEDFRDELRRRRTAIADAALDTFKVYVLRSVDTLSGLLDSENEKVRRLAAKDILEYVFRVREQQEIESRLARLERSART